MSDPVRQDTNLDLQRVSYPEDLLPEEVSDAKPVYAEEPIFPRRVMIKWALITLGIWMGWTVVTPIVAQVVKEVVAETVIQAGGDARAAAAPGDRPIVTMRNGTSITTTADGKVIIERVGKPPVVITRRQSAGAPSR